MPRVPNCPITLEPLVDPVIDPEGNTFERAAIFAWIREHGTSPITRAPLRESDLAPNRAILDILAGCLDDDDDGNVADDSTSSSNVAVTAVAGRLVAALATVDLTAHPRALAAVTGAMTVSADGTAATADAAAADNSAFARLRLLSLRSTSNTDARFETGSAHPVHIVCVIDVSGSMCASAVPKLSDGSRGEDSGLSVLDLVKHAVVTVASSLGPADRLSVVSFSDAAKTVVRTEAMGGAAGVARLRAALREVRASGRTNLWDGLRSAIDLAREGGGRPAHLFVLTDGVPNVEPARGHIPTLRRYLQQNPLHGTVSTFGFGYELDPALMRAVAREGCGTFGFIPDANFVGTVLVNALANVRSAFAVDAEIVVRGGDHAVHTGILRYGYEKVVVVNDGPEAPADYTITVRTVSGDAVVLTPEPQQASENENSNNNNNNNNNSDDSVPLGFHVARAAAARLIVLAASEQGNVPVRTALETLSAAITEGAFDAIGASSKVNRKWLRALAADLRGQVAEALSRADWHQRWGRHYLRSLGDAHTEQLCNNFKDSGVQVYGDGVLDTSGEGDPAASAPAIQGLNFGKLFAQLREELDDIFVRLPPPEPSRATGSSSAPRRGHTSASGGGGGGGAGGPADPGNNFAGFTYNNAAPSMTGYYDRTAVCFHRDTVVMRDSAACRVADLRRGDALAAVDPHGRTCVARVRCVLEMRLADRGDTLFVQLPRGGALVTMFHPVWSAATETWVHARDAPGAAIVTVDEDRVFNIVLDAGHRDRAVLLAGGDRAVTLGHGIEAGAALHAYFGTARIVADLAALPGFDLGRVTIDAADIVRAPSAVSGQPHVVAIRHRGGGGGLIRHRGAGVV